MVNADTLRKMAESFHSGTVALAEKLTGEEESEMQLFPFLVKLKSGFAFYTPSKNVNKFQHEYIHPFVVNGGFSLELKMKYLHFVETKKQQKTHNLSILYNSLTTDTKKHVRDFVKELTKNSDNHKIIRNSVVRELNIKFDWEPHKLIEKSALAFESWRYLYEEKKSGSWFAGYSELQKAFDSRINELQI